MRASNASKDDMDLRNEDGGLKAKEPMVGSSTASNSTGGDPGIKQTSSGNLVTIVSAVPSSAKRPPLASGAKAKQAAPKPGAKAAAKPKPAQGAKKPAARPKPIKGAKAPAAPAKGGRRA